MAVSKHVGIPDNVNEEFFDAVIRHQIGLLRVSGSIQKEIIDILDATEKDISEQIRRRLRKNQSTTRLNALLKTITAIRNDAWKKSAEVWRREIIEVAKAEPAFMAGALKTVSPVLLDLAIPDVATLTSLATTKPFEGKVLKDWAKDIKRADLARIEQAIKIGVTQGESSAAIARRVVGTVGQRGRNGVTEITRRQAAAITRTAVNAVSNQAKREFYVDNGDIIREEVYVATLDSRTTPICRSLDGEKFPVGEGPIPPLHIQCRSTRIAAIDGKAIGDRPQKPVTEQELVREYNRANGTQASNRAGLPRGHKGQFDSFARQRIRQKTGTIDANVSYQQWLTRQSAEFQDDILGPTRGKLFRNGDLTLKKFVNRQGDEIPLSSLARREASAFRAAGLDPEDFL